MLCFALWIQVSFGAILLSDVLSSLMLSLDNSLDSHAKILSLLVGVVKYLKSSWNGK